MKGDAVSRSTPPQRLAATAPKVRRAPPWKAVSGLTTLLLLMFSSGMAYSQDELLDRASRSLADRDPAAAYALLEGGEAERAGDPRFDYLLGVAALDSGHLTRAIFALERVLAISPENHPARAELARAYLAAGEGASARRELEQARRAEGVPPEAAAAIDRVLGALDQITPAVGPKVSGYAELGAGRDSNVNSASNVGQFAIPAFGGLLFTSDPGASRQHDLFASLAAGANLQWGLDAGWSLLATVDGRSMLNRRVHDMDTSLVDAAVGFSHADGANVQTVALQSNAAWVSSSVYRTANGASGQWQSQLDAASQASLFAQWSRQEYAGQGERNTDRTVLGTAYARSFQSTGTLAYASAYLADERARADGFDYHGHRAAGLRLGGEQRVTPQAVVYAEWQQERRRYGGSEPLFDMRRHDRQDDLLAGVRYAIAPQWQLSPQIHATRAGSNITFYDYRRTIVQLVLRKEFP